MSIELRKYQYSEDVKNYFAGGTNRPTFVDKITLSQITIDGFPSYSEEFKNQFDNFNFTFGDFTIKFSLLQPETSYNGVTLKEFLGEILNDHCIACKITLPNKVLTGFVDIESIWFNETYNQNRYDVQITCYHPEKEFKDLAEKRPETPAVWFRGINQYLENCHFWTSVPIQCNVDTSYLDWENKVGFIPSLVRSDVYDNIWGWMIANNRLAFGGQTNEVTTWELFEDLCKFFGLVYKMDFDGERADNLWGFVFKVGFRSSMFGSSSSTPIITTNEYGFQKDNSFNKYIYFKYGQKTRVKGAIANREFEWNTSDFGYGVIYDSTGNNYGVGVIVPSGAGVIENAIDKRGEALGNQYVLINEDNEGIGFPIDQVTEITASKYFNPSTDENILFSHWRFGQNGHYNYFSEPYYWFSPMNFSFPMMFQKQPVNIWLDNTNQTVNGRGNWFRTINTTDGNIFNNSMKPILDNTAFQYQFLLRDNLKKLYKYELSTLNTSYSLFDEATINGDSCRLYSLQDLDIQEQKVTGIYEQT